MKKILLSALVIISFVIYSLNQKSQATQRDLIGPPKSFQGNQDPEVQTGQRYKDGAYTGDTADAFYGKLQVKAVISDGKITDIIFIQYPFERQTSIEINEAAIPLWTQEAIQSQSADVDIVTGATQSSEAFKKSLQSALNKAKSS